MELSRVCEQCGRGSGDKSIYCIYCGHKIEQKMTTEADAELREDVIKMIDNPRLQRIWGCTEEAHIISAISASEQIVNDRKFCGNCGIQLPDIEES